MHFDDRLATVLNLPVKGDALLRIQYRQLLDVLGSMPVEAHGPQADAAFARLAELGGSIPASERAQILRLPSLRLRNLRLLALLAECEPAVASAAMGAAQIGEADWLRLIPALPVQARGILRHRRGLAPRIETLLDRLGVTDRGLPPVTDAATDQSSTAQVVQLRSAVEPAAVQDSGGIAGLRRRIEAFSKARDAANSRYPSGDEAPRLPLGDGEVPFERAEWFDFATDAEGQIVWAEPSVAPMVAGMRLASADSGPPLAAPPALRRSFRDRQPVRNIIASLTGAPAITGDWRIDAEPQFDPLQGRFTGYCGRFRRLPPDAQAEPPETQADEADRMREILHELRTPANAIQLSAEIIQQNMFGPTAHEYRALAATIASDTAQILAGFDELDRLVKLENGAVELQPGHSDLAAIAAATVEQLSAFTSRRQSGFDIDGPWPALPVGMAELEAQRLVWRLLAGLAGAASPMEQLALSCANAGGEARLCVELPASLARHEDYRAVPPGEGNRATQALSAGMFGIGFSLRLAEAEAVAAGGWLKRSDDSLILMLPALTNSPAIHSQG